ncbi:glycosyltransferase family 2 protein [Lactobacillus crispatus]|nr:glycosyltransferase family 2 protein [Lactobacillus crispatus]
MNKNIKKLIKKGMGKAATFSSYISFGRICSNLRIRKTILMILSPLGIVLLLFNKKYKNIKLKYNLSAVLIIKNEGDYIKEWIEYYKNLGFEKIYIYDNDSTDNVYKKLIKYIDVGLVSYTKMSGHARQLDAYNDALKKAKRESKYLAIVDADEFLFPVKDDDICTVLDRYMQSANNVGGLCVNWLIFGSSGYMNQTSELVTQRFKHRSKYDFNKNQHVKTICDPRKVAGVLNPHIVEYIIGCYAINSFYQKVDRPFTKYNSNAPLRINHYFTKSKNEFVRKRARGEADSLNVRNMKDFDIHDRNEVFDDSMKRYRNVLEKTTGQK